MTETTPTPQQILDCPMGPNDSGADTIRGYLVELLASVWRDGDCFNGKRPFGNSGWQWDLHKPLVQAGFIAGTIDEDGYLDDCDETAGEALIAAAIQALGATS